MKKLMPIIAVSILSLTLSGVVNAADDVQEKREELQEKTQDVKKAQQELNQEVRKEVIAEGKEANKNMLQVSRASKIIGAVVKDANGEKLGDIKELVINPETGQVVYGVVSYGGILSLGDKLFAVPWTALHWTQDKEYYLLDVDKKLLKNAPGFDKNHWPDSSDKWELQREEVNQFYHIKP